MSSTLIICADGLTVRYNGDPALENISVVFERGDRIALIGPNGAGKSTLIKTIMGMLRAASGTLTIDADPLKMGYVPQNEDVKWDFPVTVYDVVMMGCARRVGWLRLPGRVHRQIVYEALDTVGMSAFAGRQIGDLSGGQRRRAFIARALAQDAELLILDEPFSGVDAAGQADLMDVLDDLNRGGMTILLSTHDLDLAFRRFDKVLALRRRVIAFGTPDEVYTTETLNQLYGSRIIALHDGQPMRVFVDDHHCEEC